MSSSPVPRLDSTLLSRAQMNNYSVAAAQAAVMAANSLASLSQAALMPSASSFSPALLGQFLPPPVSSVYNIRTSRPAPSTSRPSSSGPTASGNADAPPTRVPGTEGRNIVPLINIMVTIIIKHSLTMINIVIIVKLVINDKHAIISDLDLIPSIVNCQIRRKNC